MNNHCNVYLKCIASSFSDHNAVELVVNMSSSKHMNIDPKLVYSYKNANWARFQRHISQDICQNLNNLLKPSSILNLESSSIDNSILALTNSINSAMDRNIKKVNIHQFKSIDFPKFVISIIKHKNKIKRTMFR